MLIDINTLIETQESDFKSLFPDTSFPAMLTDEHITPFGYAVLNYDLPSPIPGRYQKTASAPVQLVEGKYHAQWTVVDMTSDEIIAFDARIQREIVNQTQSRLDDFAQTRGYDGIMSACTYSDSSIPAFSTEGKYAVIARDTTWAALYTLLAEVERGTKPKPTGYADVEALLPSLIWPV